MSYDTNTAMTQTSSGLYFKAVVLDQAEIFGNLATSLLRCQTICVKINTVIY